MNKDFTIINFHGYEFGKKGSRSKIELMENINTKKGLTKKRKNILGGNFNFIENVKDRLIDLAKLQVKTFLAIEYEHAHIS